MTTYFLVDRKEAPTIKAEDGPRPPKVPPHLQSYGEFVIAVAKQLVGLRERVDTYSCSLCEFHRCIIFAVKRKW